MSFIDRAAKSYSPIFPIFKNLVYNYLFNESRSTFFYIKANLKHF